jgi:photosystem II stability/assembly factor-like uncharacterized protein
MKKQDKIFVIVLMLFMSMQLLAQSTWNHQNSGVNFDLKAVDFIDSQQGIAVGMFGTILHTIDGGITWTKIELGINNSLNDVQYINRHRIIIGGDQGLIIYSPDGGENWETAQQANQDYNIYAIAVDGFSGNGIAGGSGNTVLWTNDYGLSWTYVDGGFINNYYCACMAGGEFGAVIGRNAIFEPLAAYTNDSGQTWDTVDFYPTVNNVAYESTVYGCYFFTPDDGFTVGTTFDAGGFITTNPDWNGQYWEAQLFPGIMFFGIDFINNSYGVAVGGDYNATTYIYETYNGGINWEPASIHSDGNTMLDVSLVDNTGYAVGTFGEILKMESSTEIPEKVSQPYRLYNYPNPTQNHTEIFLELSQSENIHLAVYDINGEKVEELYDGFLASGSHSFSFDTQRLAPGLYYLTFANATVLTSRKLVIN